MLKRWHAGCRDALQLFRAIQRQGYTGRYPPVARYAQRVRQAPGLRPREQRPGQTLPLVAAGPPPLLPTRGATRVVLKLPRKRPDADLHLVAPLTAQPSTLAMAITLAQDFAEIGRERQPDRCDRWLERATARTGAPLRRFAKGLWADDAAGTAGLTLRWSNGPVEGQRNRVKMLTRSMVGRAKIDRLSRRVLRAASPGGRRRFQGPPRLCHHVVPSSPK
jgi:transposase